MPDPQRQAAGVPGGGLGPDLIQRQPQPRGQPPAAGDHVGGLHPVRQVHHGQVPGAVPVDLGRERDRVRVLRHGRVDPGQLHRQQRAADQFRGELAVRLALAHPVGDRLVRRAARPRRHRHRQRQRGQPPQRQPRQDGQQGRARGQHDGAADQDGPPPAGLALAAGIQGQPCPGVALVGGSLAQVPVPFLGRGPPDQPGRGAERAGHRVHRGLDGVLRRADRVEPRVIAGLLGRPRQRGGQRGAGRQPRRHDRRAHAAAARGERARLVLRVDRAAGQDAADQDRLTVHVVIVVIVVAVRPVTGDRRQRGGPPVTARVPAVRGGIARGGQEQHVGVAVDVAGVLYGGLGRGALAEVELS